VKTYKTSFVLIALILSTSLFGQSYNNFYGNIVNLSSFDTINNNLMEFESLGVKEHGSVSAYNTLNWLINKYSSYGYTNIEIDTFNFSNSDGYNLIVTKQGTLYPNTYLIVDGHYDTQTGTGTNDNGSGVSIILEIARLLQNVSTEYSIKFINFGGEEVGLVGSSFYVNNNVIPNNMDIKLLFNIDEVGGVNGMTNNTVVCERDESTPIAANAASADFTDTLATLVSLYSNLLTEISYAYSSDYMPFQNNNNIITGLFEKNQSPYTHSSLDNLANLDVNYVYEIAKASIGVSLYFAVAYPLITDIKKEKEFDLSIYPNPAKDLVYIDLGNLTLENTSLKLINIVGETIIEKRVNQQLELLKLASIPSGIYTLVVTSSSFQITEKIVH